LATAFLPEQIVYPGVDITRASSSVIRSVLLFGMVETWRQKNFRRSHSRDYRNSG
jgi:hypothetical protein